MGRWSCRSGVECHRSTSTLPKAHYLNQRTMEIFRQHGVDPDAGEPSCPAAAGGHHRLLSSGELPDPRDGFR
ncbi:FAD-dependent monooxygenase [Kribbella sp. CA-253562]|uniref:FAD-dependent monooxygenase n=1 Tax=Kribbella sp. CA-253562 TaxID=3239942 RepID=UPI003D8FD429